jgi:serine/threonine protein kinase
MPSRAPSVEEHAIRAFALNVRTAAGVVVTAPGHIRDLATLDSARYGQSLNAWAEGMRAGGEAAPGPNRTSTADTTYYLCTNCFEARDRLSQNDTSNLQAFVEYHCPTCGLQRHLLLRIAGNRKKDAPKLYPVQKVNMSNPTRTSRLAAAEPPSPDRLASAITSVRPGSVAAKALAGEFWDRPLTDSEHRFRRIFGDEAPASPTRRNTLNVDGQKYAPVVRIGDSDIPLLRTHQYFADYLKGGNTIRASNVDAAGKIMLNGKLGTGTYGLVLSVSPKSRKSEHAMKMMLSFQPTYTNAANNVRHLHIDKSNFPLYDEYVTGMGFRIINESLPKGMSPLNAMAPECIFGLIIPGGWNHIEDDGAESHAPVAVAICIIMPKMAMDSTTAIKRLPIQSQRIVFVRNLLRSVASTLVPLHESDFIHADIKTDNILIPRNVDPSFLPDAAIEAVICDYSLSRYGPADYICMSPDYRAPEVWLQLQWTTAIDIWGLACVAIEAYTGGTFFVDDPPKCEKPHEFVQRIVSYFGPIPEYMVRASPRETDIRGAVRGVPSRDPGLLLRSASRSTSPIADDIPHEQALLNLLSRMLVIDPAVRCTAADILTDPFLASH